MSDFELPTDKQLEHLREGGLSPYSSFLTASFIAIVVSLCIFFCFDSCIDIFNNLNSFDDILQKKLLLIKLLFLPPVVVLISALLFILFQRKFYVKISFLYPLFRKKLKFGLFSRFVFSFIKVLFLLALASGMVFIVLYYLYPYFGGMLTNSSEDNLVIFHLALKSFLPIFIIVEFCLLFFWFVIYKLLFLFSVILNKNKVLDR